MTDIKTRQSQLVDRIFKLSLEKKLNWKQVSFDGFETKIGDLKIVLDTITYEDSPFERVKILSNSGVELQTFSDGSISDIPLSDEKFDTWWKKMAALRELAKFQAARTEETLDEVMDVLDRIDRGEIVRSDDDDVPF